MDLLVEIFMILNVRMKVPELYGDFHKMFLAATIFTTACCCILLKHMTQKGTRLFVFITSLLVIALELYKQVVYSFSYIGGEFVFDYQWYIFPFQFCSTPMYVGLLASIVKKGRLQESLYAYLATYSIFAGACVMVYPGNVFIDKVGINFQTMIWHGSMIVVGVVLFYTGIVKCNHKTILKAMPVFATTVGMAAIMNEIAYQTGLLETEGFNMFYISPYCAPSLPVYSLVQQVVPFPVSLVIYILGFTLAAYIILLIAMGVNKVAHVVGTKHFTMPFSGYHLKKI